MTKEEFNEIAQDVYMAVKYAENKHPVFPNDLISKTSILTEEAGEAAKEANFTCLEGKNRQEEYINEVTQAACVCFRILHSLKNRYK